MMMSVSGSRVCASVYSNECGYGEYVEKEDGWMVLFWRNGKKKKIIKQQKYIINGVLMLFVVTAASFYARGQIEKFFR